jgi:hypothetical protein
MVEAIAGSMTFRKTVNGRAPIERATVTSVGGTWRTPASTESTTGKKPSSTPKAIFDAGPRPKKSISDGYQITLGTA